MAKKTIKEKIETKVEDVIEDVKEEATEDVATFTIDRWHVALAAIAVTAIILVFVL